MLKKTSAHLRIVRFETWHLDWLNFEGEFLREGLGLADRITPEQAKLLERLSDSWTGLQDGTVQGCGGFTPICPGVLEIWMYLGDKAFDRKKTVLRFMKYVLNDIIKKRKPHRIQAVVKTDFHAGIKFAEAFGFKNEGLMRKFSSNKEDFYRYARIID